MKRTTCENWNYKKALGPVGCMDGRKCKYFCDSYNRRIPWKHWTPPISACKHMRYYYKNNKRQECAACMDLKKDHTEFCPKFEVSEKYIAKRIYGNGRVRNEKAV